MAVHTYDPQKVQVIVGAAPISGFADGTFLTVEQEGDDFTTTVGADGEVTRTRNAARNATMALTLKSTSLANAILSGLRASEAVFPILIKDGANIVAAGEGWIQKPPAFERGDEAGDHEWMLALGKWSPVFGGNP
jgi:hypothetical protein